MDGLSLIAALRAQNNGTPALILSALGQVDDRVKGLRAGGDDYLSKPYAFSELLARVEVLARRLPVAQLPGVAPPVARPLAAAHAARRPLVAQRPRLGPPVAQLRPRSWASGR